MLSFKLKKQTSKNVADTTVDIFWRTVKPLFSDISKSRRTITLIEDVKTESNHKKNS